MALPDFLSASPFASPISDDEAQLMSRVHAGFVDGQERAMVDAIHQRLRASPPIEVR